MEHTKYYNDIRVPYETFIKKAFNYANPNDEPKTITVYTSSPYLRIKQQTILIQPYSSALIQLRMYFNRTAAPNTQAELHIQDGEEIEHLIFNFVLHS